MSHSEIILSALAASPSGFLSGHELLGKVTMGDLNIAERRGLIIYTQVQIGPSFHYVYKAA